MSCTSDARRLSTGSSGVLFFASSLRSSARSQPPCTKVSLPSGRTSVIVAWRSTFGVDERTHAFTAPAPITVVLAVSGLVTYDAALPAGGWTQLYGGVAVHNPFVPAAVSPVKSVSGRALAFQVNTSAPACVGGVSASEPPGPMYQERPVVPGIGKLGQDCSKPGCGWPADWPPAPLSNITRIDGSFSNAASAPA